MKRALVCLLVGLFAFSVLAVGAAPKLKGKVALVIGGGGLGDMSFSDLANKGLTQAGADFGLKVVVVQSATAADYLPNLLNAARSHEFDLIIATGFQMADPLKEVAPRYPMEKFACIDWVVDFPNVRSILFEEQQMSALVGAMAAMVANYYNYPWVGVVLGVEIPVLYRFEGGYRFGIDWGNKTYSAVTGKPAATGLLWTYTGTFDDISKGKAATEAQLMQGAGLVYNVAGPLGLGDLEAITEALESKGKTAGPPFMIGVDANQDWLGDGSRVIASGMKKVDVACYEVVKSVAKGTFKGGTAVMNLSNKGVAISRFQDLQDSMDFGVSSGHIDAAARIAIAGNWAQARAAIPSWIWNAVDSLETQILSGNVVVPKAETLDQIKAIRSKYPLEKR